MAGILLVHGAFGGAWAWEPALAGLREAGHTVQAIDLPAAGEDKTPVADVTLGAYGERICRALDEGEPAVLVGQSMGGMAITQAAANCPERVVALIYVGAFAPLEGQSLTSLVAYPEAADDQVQAHMVVQGDPPVAILPPAGARIALYNCATPEQARWGSERLGPQPVAAFQTPLVVPDANREAFERLSRGYMLCLHDQAIPPAMQRRMIEDVGCRPVVEIDADHWPWLSRTDAFHAALEQLVQATAGLPH